MNKILFSLILAGVSFLGVQGVSAGKIPEENNKKPGLPKTISKSRAEEVPKTWRAPKYVPAAPSKNPARLQRIANFNPFNFEMRGNILVQRDTSKDKKIIITGGRVYRPMNEDKCVLQRCTLEAGAPLHQAYVSTTPEEKQ